MADANTAISTNSTDKIKPTGDHLWKKGQPSANPKGRPTNAERQQKQSLKLFSLKTAGKDLKEALKINSQAAILDMCPKIIEKAKDNTELTKLLFEYGFGKPKQQIEVITINYDFTGWSAHDVAHFRETGNLPERTNKDSTKSSATQSPPLLEVSTNDQ